MQLSFILLDFLTPSQKDVVNVASMPEYIWQIYAPIIIWLALVLILLIILLKKYTLKDWGDKKNPFQDESLGMPRGTFRSILTMTLLYVAVVLELVSVHTVGFEENVSEFLTAFQMMIAFYFGSKVMHHITSTDKAKTELISKENVVKSETLKSIATVPKKDEMVTVKKDEIKHDVKKSNEAELFDDGTNEGIDESEQGFDEEKAFGGDDPDAKG